MRLWSVGGISSAMGLKDDWIARSVVLAVVMQVVGCGPTPREIELEKQVNAKTVEIIELNDRLMSRDARIHVLTGQLQNVVGRGEAGGKPVFEITEVQLLDITSGVDIDGEPGDDGVVIYVRPVDQDGDTLKRAGEIRIKLLDNSGIGQPKLISQVVVNDPEQVRRAWYGKFWTDYFKLTVPFAPGARLVPGHEIDVHVTFVEFATGRTFSARRAIKIARISPDE